jgi:hypothetical protein
MRFASGEFVRTGALAAIEARPQTPQYRRRAKFEAPWRLIVRRRSVRRRRASCAAASGRHRSRANSLPALSLQRPLNSYHDCSGARQECFPASCPTAENGSQPRPRRRGPLTCRRSLSTGLALEDRSRTSRSVLPPNSTAVEISRVSQAWAAFYLPATPPRDHPAWCHDLYSSRGMLDSAALWPWCRRALDVDWCVEPIARAGDLSSFCSVGRFLPCCRR